jgi:flagellar motor switch/type III secretory pathway protein FliN
MDMVTGKTDRAEKDSAAKDVSQIITNHLQKISVPVTIQLGVTMLNFEQMITLQADNVIVLDKKVQEDADLVVQGRKLMQGRLARVNGNKALVITDGVV